ncbi:MAG: CPXCG motif-containing cysteine-rich protein [Mariniblastus sp.]
MDYDFDDDEWEQSDEENDLDDNEVDDDDDDDANSDDETELFEEAAYICNSCGEEIVVPLDYSGGQRQEYVEDCPVCCNPNVIFVEYDSDGEANVWSRAEQDPN